MAMAPVPCLRCCRRAVRPLHRRFNSTSSTSPPPPPPPTRWLADLKARLGKCLIFGCSPAQVGQAAAVLRGLSTEWRELTAGSEGFLTGGRRGMEGQQVVWGEMDSFGHVNNVVYARYAESSRVNWINNFAVHVDPGHRDEWAQLMTPRGVGLILKSLQADFKFPLTYPDRVSVYHKLRAAPAASPAPTSLVLECMILSHRHRRVSARTVEDIAIYDYRAAKKTEMPPFMHSVLSATWQLQQSEAERARRRIWDLVAQVEALEAGTWNRPDAKEDLGGAGGKR